MQATHMRHGFSMESFGAARFLVLGACWAALELVAGCASTEEGPYRFSDGWRKARVERIVQGSTLEKPSFWPCTRHTSLEERSQRTYAVVAYRDMHHTRRHLVQLTPEYSVRTGVEVYANISKCEYALAHYP